MPTVTICTQVSTSITSLLLIWMKLLSNRGMLVNMANSPLHSCCCSLPMEPWDMYSMRLLWALPSMASCCCSSVRHEDCCVSSPEPLPQPEVQPLPSCLYTFTVHCDCSQLPTQQCVLILIAAPLPSQKETILLQAATLQRGRKYRICLLLCETQVCFFKATCVHAATTGNECKRLAAPGKLSLLIYEGDTDR